jgi:hypothetical protein
MRKVEDEMVNSAPKSQHDLATAPDRSFLEDILINHGPANVLGRFFLFADTYLKDRGVTLSSTTLEAASVLQETYKDSWSVFPPMLDTRLSPIPEAMSYCLIGRNDKGDVVTSQGGRIFDLHDRSFADIVDDQSFFYGLGGQPQPGQPTCKIWSPVAKRITGRFVYSGALWVRPDFRGRQFASVLPRLSRSYALAHWGTTHTVSFISQSNMLTPLKSMYGYSRFDDGFCMSNIGNVGDVTGPLMWMEADELADDLSRFMAAQIDAAVRNRGAQDEGRTLRTA